MLENPALFKDEIVTIQVIMKLAFIAHFKAENSKTPPTPYSEPGNLDTGEVLEGKS